MNSQGDKIDEFYKGLIIKSLIAFNWRGFHTNNAFKSVYKWISDIIGLDKINIPVEERQKNYLTTASQEMEHSILLRKYREFLNDTGIIYYMAKMYIKIMSIKFYIATGNNKFITSDNPSFICNNVDGKLVHIMSISPDIVMTVGINKNHEEKYYIERISSKDVTKINKIIYDNSIEKVITNNNKMKFY
ncbi:hypothetical protein BJV85_000372 [Clostridium acetobutylicum]|uniref:DUF4238 domain-containing protein n=1 Tax=Clostridium TaxID=1485 RepID=UPI000200BF9D|nr:MULTISPECIES: DUF4238 domain-containing protein [Clostridium]ADZ22572.1 Conserved hypothetical protein [Clostridium acetobutylicum EA 2018]NOV87401.1 hypothetical protein [Clostridium acetobutylicum]NOW14254.1 hypothetical protein [Clostridium acetobutylicum]NRY58269.1 hypothetical protein [Clostridium acetobutylicum]NSA91526.1 hypothetical protein [Clostridium acetobutylicum]